MEVHKSWVVRNFWDYGGHLFGYILHLLDFWTTLYTYIINVQYKFMYEFDLNFSHAIIALQPEQINGKSLFEFNFDLLQYGHISVPFHNSSMVKKPTTFPLTPSHSCHSCSFTRYRHTCGTPTPFSQITIVLGFSMWFAVFSFATRRLQP